MRKEKEFYKRESTYLIRIRDYESYLEKAKDSILEAERRIKSYEADLEICRMELEEFRDFNREIKKET